MLVNLEIKRSNQARQISRSYRQIIKTNKWLNRFTMCLLSIRIVRKWHPLCKRTWREEILWIRWCCQTNQISKFILILKMIINNCSAKAISRLKSNAQRIRPIITICRFSPQIKASLKTMICKLGLSRQFWVSQRDRNWCSSSRVRSKIFLNN